MASRSVFRSQNTDFRSCIGAKILAFQSDAIHVGPFGHEVVD